MNTIPYQIIIRWSETDQAYEASIPALQGCLAYGDTPEEAAQELTIAADLWMEAAKAHNKPIPRPDATLERLASLAPILNLSAIARVCSIPVQTIASKIKRGTPLSEKENEALSSVLASHGLR
jgi:predicted RNase H-like HicB family nuclease